MLLFDPTVCYRGLSKRLTCYSFVILRHICIIITFAKITASFSHNLASLFPQSLPRLHSSSHDDNEGDDNNDADDNDDDEDDVPWVYSVVRMVCSVAIGGFDPDDGTPCSDLDALLV